MNIKDKRVSFLKYWNLPSIVIIALLLVITTGCEKDDEPPVPVDNNSISKQVSSDDDNTSFELKGARMIVPSNSVPKLMNGDPATVSFTIEVGSELPKELPEGMTLIDESAHFGPEGFIFQEPIWLTFNLPEGIALDQVSIVGFLSDTQEYGIIPISYFDEENKVVGVAVYELGHYFMLNVNGTNRPKSVGSSGGFRLNSNITNNWYPNILGTTGLPQWASADTYFKMIITDFEPAYPGDLAWWAEFNPNTNGGRKYWELSTPPMITGWKPNHWVGITAHLPQGAYTAQIIASHKQFQSDLPECRQYSIPLTFNISKPLECQQVFGCEGWSNGPDFPANGSWEPVNCWEYTPLATIPVCTGEFQATLTWNNGTNGDTDLDLYLKGPDGLTVSYENKIPGIGGIILDRDVISDSGPCQENICAPTLSGMPSGEYEVLVDHFDGIAKNYQVRILNGAVSQSFSGSISPGDPIRLISMFKLD